MSDKEEGGMAHAVRSVGGPGRVRRAGAPEMSAVVLMSVAWRRNGGGAKVAEARFGVGAVVGGAGIVGDTVGSCHRGVARSAP